MSGIMPPETAQIAPTGPVPRHDGWRTLQRFLPYLWPHDNPALRWRIVVASALVALSTAVQMALPLALKWAVDAMNVAGPRAITFVLLTVVAYSTGRFVAVVFDNIRNFVFERVGQDATRKLAEHVFARLHRLSMRFHLARRTGGAGGSDCAGRNRLYLGDAHNYRMAHAFARKDEPARWAGAVARG